ncbi:MAG: START domain-containing protein, partial [Pseudomonadota bacterium]
MKKLTVTAFAVAASLLVALPSAASASWKKAKSGGGVTVWTKEVPGKTLKDMKAETVITAKITDIAHLLNDASAYKSWVADLRTSRLIKRVSATENILYFVQKTPVIKDRDVVIRGRVTQNAASKVLTVNMQGIKGHVKESAKYVRLPKMNGKFVFTPIGGGKLKVVYTLSADPGGKIPASLANKFAVDTPFKTLKGLKQISKNLAKYR